MPIPGRASYFGRRRPPVIFAAPTVGAPRWQTSYLRRSYPLQEAERLVDELSGWGRTILVFSGGEPLLRPDIFHLMSYANKKGLVVALATNGTLDRPGSGQAHP